MDVKNIERENEIIAKLMTAASMYYNKDTGYGHETTLQMVGHMLNRAGLTICKRGEEPQALEVISTAEPVERFRTVIHISMDPNLTQPQLEKMFQVLERRGLL